MHTVYMYVCMYVNLCSLSMCVWKLCMYACVMHVQLYSVSIVPVTDE